MIKFIFLKSALKCDSVDVTIGIKIFRVLVTIEPGRFLLQFVTTNCLIVFKAKLGLLALHNEPIIIGKENMLVQLMRAHKIYKL